jgi:integrase
MAAKRALDYDDGVIPFGTVPPQYDYIEPRLVDYKGDLSKDWYIIYYIWNTEKNCKVRKRAIVKGDSKTARKAYARKEIEQISEYLKAGYTVGKKQPVVKLGEVDMNTLTLEAAVEHAISRKGASIKPNTLKSYQSFRNVLKEWIETAHYQMLLLKDVKAGTIHEFFDYLKGKRKVENKTYNNYLGYLTTIFNWYISREYLVRNPCNKVEKLKVQSGGHTPYTNAQVKQIKELIEQKGDQQLLLFIQFIFYTLVRPGELRQLRISNIGDKTLFISPDISKNRKGEHVLIPPALERLIIEFKLRDYPKQLYIFGNKGVPSTVQVGSSYFYKRHRKILNRLGLVGEEYDLYAYKHTAVINLFNAGVDIKDIQRQCRHASISQTDQYLKNLGLIKNDELMVKYPEF